MTRKKIPMIGKRFGLWDVIGVDLNDPLKYICQCDCGTVKSVFGTHLRGGKSKSCGGVKHMKNPITFNGKIMPLKSWADHTGIPYGTLYNRIKRGWSIDRALTKD